MDGDWVFFVDIGGIVDHQFLEVIVCFVDIGRIVDHYCLEAIVYFVDIAGIVDHYCLEVIAYFVNIGVICDYHCFNKPYRLPKGQTQMDNPEKLQNRVHKTKKNKTKHNIIVLDTTMRK